MNKNAKKWVEALRSGEYEQGKSYLRIDDEFCCLGIACDLYAKETGEGGWKSIPDRLGIAFEIGRLHNTVTLPLPVRRWLGLSTESGRFRGGPSDNLADLNDDDASFSQIADVIEREPEGLFA